MNRIESIFRGEISNHLLPFLWLHGADEEKLRTMLRVIHESGCGAVCLEARPHPDYCGEGWWHDLDILLEEAEALNMKVWVLDDAHFPTGFANGTVSSAPERLRRWFLTEKHIDLDTDTPREITVDLRSEINIDPESGLRKEAVYREQILEVLLGTLVPVPDGDCVGRLSRITNGLQDGRVSLCLPKGKHRLYILSKTLNAAKFQSEGISFLEADSVKLLIDAVYEPHYQHFGHRFGKTFAGFFSDEPGFFNLRETGYGFPPRVGDGNEPLPWSDGLYQQLRDLFGEDTALYLPALFGEKIAAPEHDRRIRCAYMDLVSRAFEENFSRQIGDWCHERGIEHIGHVVEDIPSYERLGQGTGHYFRAIRHQDMAGIDVVLNTLLPDQGEDSDFYLFGLPQLAASCAAQSPCQNGCALCELFGAYGWSEGVTLMKWLADFFLTHGINEFVPHAFTDAPFPDSDCPPHFWAEGNNPQYSATGQLFRYMNRMAELLGKTQPLVRNAVLFEAENDWAGDTMPYYLIGRELIQSQREYHLVCLDDLGSAQCENGCLRIGCMCYERLFVPATQFMSEEEATRLKALSDCGLFVALVGCRPRAFNGNEWEALAALPVLSPAEVAASAAPAAVCLNGADVKYIHVASYQGEQERIHVLFNSSLRHSVITGLSFASAQGETACIVKIDMIGRRYEGIWTNGQSLTLEPGECAVFVELPQNEIPENCPAAVPEEAHPIKTGFWSFFSADYRSPDLWKAQGSGEDPEALIQSLPDFSGTLCCEAEILFCGERELLLSGAREAITLWLDGERLGCCIGAPYRYLLPGEITGRHRLRLELDTTLHGAVKDRFSQPDKLPELSFGQLCGR